MIDNRLAPFGIFILRVALGLMFVAHALLKYVVFTMPGFAAFMAQIGFPSILAWPVFLAELVGGIAIILGLYSRWVAAALVPVLIGALMVHVPNGWLFTAPNGGWEYPAFLVVVAVAHALTGDGAFALKPSPTAAADDATAALARG